MGQASDALHAIMISFLLGVVKRIQGAFFVATCSTGDFRASLRTTKVRLRILQTLGDDRRT